MRILFICPAFPPINNAIGEYVKYLSLELLNKGHEIGVLTATSIEISSVADKLKYFDQATFLATKIDNSKIQVLPWISNWANDFSSCLQTVHSFYKPDVISLQYEPYSYHAKGLPIFFIPSISKLKNIHFSVTFHEVYNRNYIWSNKLYYLLSVSQKLLARKISNFSRASFTSLDLFINVFIKSHKPQKLFIGSNIYTPKKLLEKQYDFFENGSTRKLVSFGVKDYNKILEALYILSSAKKIKLEYHIIGNLPPKLVENLHIKIKSLGIEELVIIHGFLANNFIENIFLSSHLFVDANYADNKFRGGTTLKSGSLAAAFQFGLPILGYSGDMTDKLLIHNKNIFFTKNSTSTEIANSINFLLNNPNLLFNLHKGSLNFFSQQISWDVIADKFTNALNNQNTAIN
ncbi:MAG: glycosyltransferase [Sediminibacterium sp.]|nr:glycosyltransferase [Sediminibacterium sp.]